MLGGLSVCLIMVTRILVKDFFVYFEEFKGDGKKRVHCTINLEIMSNQKKKT